MTKPMEPYLTREAILTANGLLAAHLEWARAKAEARADATVERERRTLGALIMGLTHVASAAVTALAAKKRFSRQLQRPLSERPSRDR